MDAERQPPALRAPFRAPAPRNGTRDSKGATAPTYPAAQRSITNEAIENLGLKAGEKAVAIIKATDVIVGVE